MDLEMRVGDGAVSVGAVGQIAASMVCVTENVKRGAEESCGPVKQGQEAWWSEGEEG